MKILLAEDAPDARLVASLCFRNTEFVLEMVENGELAVERFRAGGFELVLLDMHMPVMGGGEAARRMRAHESEHGLPRTPIVGLSATSFPADVQSMLAEGCDEVLAKPIDRAVLIASVRRMLGAAERG